MGIVAAVALRPHQIRDALIREPDQGWSGLPDQLQGFGAHEKRPAGAVRNVSVVVVCVWVGGGAARPPLGVAEPIRVFCARVAPQNCVYAGVLISRRAYIIQSYLGQHDGVW